MYCFALTSKINCMKKWSLVLLLMVHTPLLFGQSAEEYKEMAEKKMELKNYQYAMELMNKAIALDTKNQWYYLRKADIQFRLSGPTDAIKTVKQAMSLDTKAAEPYNRAGSYYDSGGFPDTAIMMYNEAIKYAKDDTMKYSYTMNRGVAKGSMRDFPGAIKDFESVLAFDPNNIGALNNISPCYRQLGMPHKSIASLKKIILIDPAFVGTYINLGFIYSELDSLDQSVAYFNKALELDPNEPVTYNNRGYVYYKKRDYANALTDINRSIKMYPTNSYAYRNIALVYIALNKMNEACNALSYALSYGFEKRYGTEVSELADKYCEKK